MEIGWLWLAVALCGVVAVVADDARWAGAGLVITAGIFLLPLL